MAIDWNYLFDVKVDDLSDDRLESLYEELIKFDPKNEENIERLRKLLEVSQSVLQIKSVQAEVAIEEMKETTKKFDTNEVEILRKELEMFKKSDFKGENIGYKLSEANNTIIELKNSIETKESENIKLKRKLNDLQNTIDFREKEVLALRSELESLRDEMESQRHISDDTNDREESLEKIREKNQQIQTLLDELKDAEILNLELTNNCKKLKLELKSATNELQISCNQMEMMSKQINELKQLNEDFLSEKKFLMEEIERTKQNLNKYESGDRNLIDDYVDNLKDLQNLIRIKDEELIQLKASALIPDEELKELKKRMSKELEEREKQIDLLKSQLNEAVNDMETQTEIIRSLYQQNKGDEEVSKLNDKISVLNTQLKSTEEEALAKDEELLSLRKRINTYERGEYGLKDALKEITDLTKHLNNRDQRIEEMVQQMNNLKLDLNEAEDSLNGITERKDTKSDQDKPKTSKTIIEEQKISNKRDKIKILEMERKILELEDQKIALTERLSLNKSVDKYKRNQEINDLKESLNSIEAENSELHLGMKEILSGIRETDSQSDLIIECPTLERLCKLIESRSIASDLTNVIALKAELDLVRGHNEQLRTDMRLMRSDYLKVISQYTQDLLENDIIFDEFEDQNKSQTNSQVFQKLINFSDKKETIFTDNEDNNQNVFQQQKQQNKEEEEIIEKEDKNEDKEKDKNKDKEEDKNKDKEEDEKEEDEEELGQFDIKNEELNVSQLLVVDKVSVETQTFPIIEKKEIIEKKNIEMKNIWTQTDTLSETISQTKPLIETTNKSDVNEMTSKTMCENCPKLMKIVNFLKDCIEKLEQNINCSETKFLHRLELLQNENKNLSSKLSLKEKQLNEREKQINELQNKAISYELMIATPFDTPLDTSLKEENRIVTYRGPESNRNQFKSDSKTDLSLSCKTVLESVINCLQARLQHKDESIRQYRSMLSETKQNFENEMIRLLESIRENDRKNSIDFKQMIDNEELESALKSCVNELELCKTELNSRISHLENELEAKSAKLMAFENENVELRFKPKTPNNQLKQTIEEMREELKQKDSVISSLSKTIKDDRAMRALSLKRPKDESIVREKKVENELFQEIADLRAIVETQKKTISGLEIVKWDLEKNIKEFKEQLKQKLKDKDNEINELKTKIEKIKLKLNKNENERQLLQSKVLKKEIALKNSQNKSIQTTSTLSNTESSSMRLKSDLRKTQNQLKQRESEIQILNKDLELSHQIEDELKTLLRESVKREKLATIHEESTQMDQQMEQLLRENAQIKVELRMAEFELKKRST